jgi:hypothetical protein
MATYTYPSRDLDKPQRLLDQLGSFWAGTYAGSFQAERYVFGRARLEQQTEQITQEAVDAVSRFQVPVYHTDLWYQLVLKESDLNSEVAISSYGEGRYYGPDPDTGLDFQYGVPNSIAGYAFPAPANLVAAPLIFNRLSDPSLSLLPGLDFTLDRDRTRFIFRTNPFDNELIPKRNIYQGDQVVDREAALWVQRAQIDKGYVYTHFGHVLRLHLQSSQAYRTLVNGIWDGIVEGGHYLSVADSLAAVADAETVQGEEETVVDVVTDALHLLVITDARVYRYNLNAVAVVSVGDVVRRGDQLIEAVKIYEFNRGELPDDLRAVTLSSNFLVHGYYDGVTFYNKTVDVVVDTSDVFTRVSFELGGWPGDVAKFWEDFHVRGVAAGQTLAHLLDTRTNKVGEPGVSNLPGTINPLGFLVENVLRNNVFVIRLKPTQFGPNALPLWTVNQLRRIVPPHTGYIVIVQLDVDEDNIVMEGPGTETEAGYTEELVPYLASEVISEDLEPDSYVSEEVLMRYIDGICI